MPISTNSWEWNEGRTLETLESQVLEFLTSNRGSAFTISEIIEGMKFKPVERLIAVTRGIAMQVSLEYLVKEGKVVGKIISMSSGPTPIQPYFTVP